MLILKKIIIKIIKKNCRLIIIPVCHLLQPTVWIGIISKDLSICLYGVCLRVTDMCMKNVCVYNLK